MPLIEELTTILDCSFGDPCIDQSVFGDTPASSIYWTSSTAGSSFANAWHVNFGYDGESPDPKNFLRQVRAVRGGW
jgi:hypothetical protein